MADSEPAPGGPAERVPLATIAREWARIGIIGFGGPSAHIVLLRKLCVDNTEWLSAREFEDGIAATNLLPGPASTQLAIFCAWRLRSAVGAILGGACFIVPGLVIILALSVLFLAGHPPLWVQGAAAGAGAVVPAVAVHAAVSLLPASWRRAAGRRAAQARWLAYLAAGAVAGATAGPFVVAVLLGSGLIEVAASLRTEPRQSAGGVPGLLPLLAGPAMAGPAVAAGGLGALAWVAVKVGALSYGGGFVIIPLMQHDAVVTYHWMTGAQFLNAVALGQITPGPVVQTVAVVGYAAAGIGGGLLAALIAFLPSFVFVLAGGPHFGRLRSSVRAQSFLAGAGPAAIGAIAGAAIPLSRELGHRWQAGLLLLALCWLLLPSRLLTLRRSVVTALLGSAVIGMIAALAGAPVSH